VTSLVQDNEHDVSRRVLVTVSKTLAVCAPEDFPVAFHFLHFIAALVAELCGVAFVDQNEVAA